MKKTVSITIALFALASVAAYGEDCPCENNQKPYAGKDKCGKDVCDADKVNKWPTDLSGITPCTPTAPTSGSTVPNQTLEVTAKNENKTKLIDGIQWTFFIQVPTGSISGHTSTFGGWTELESYRDNSSECGIGIPGKTVNQTDWDPDLTGLAKIVFKTSKVALDVFAALTNKSGAPSVPTVFGKAGVEGKIQYGRAYKGTATLSGGTWSGPKGYVTSSRWLNGTLQTGPALPYTPELSDIQSLSLPRVESRECETSCCPSSS
jgi:hypothetical protein